MTKQICVYGLGFGDEGKGSIIDYLCRVGNTEWVVLVNGGHQARHHITSPDGKTFGIAQLGSGILAGANTYISNQRAINFFSLEVEACKFEQLFGWNPRNKIWIDEYCPILTVFHANVVREWEKLRTTRHGSTGVGLAALRCQENEEPNNVLLVKDLHSYADFKEKITDLNIWTAKQIKNPVMSPAQLDHYIDNTWVVIKKYIDRYNIVKSNFTRNSILHNPKLIYETSQGTLLDERFGFHPNNTWSQTTPRAAITLRTNNNITDDNIGLYKLGVIRSYYTRHGDGPFPTEWELNLTKYTDNEDNVENPHAGQMRYGCFDLLLFNYALEVSKADGVAFTHLDLSENVDVCNRYFDPIANNNQDTITVTENPDGPSYTQLAAINQMLKRVTPRFSDTDVIEYIDYFYKYMQGISTDVVSFGKSSTSKCITNPQFLTHLI